MPFQASKRRKFSLTDSAAKSDLLQYSFNAPRVTLDRSSRKSLLSSTGAHLEGSSTEVFQTHRLASLQGRRRSDGSSKVARNFIGNLGSSASLHGVARARSLEPGSWTDQVGLVEGQDDDLLSRLEKGGLHSVTAETSPSKIGRVAIDSDPRASPPNELSDDGRMVNGAIENQEPTTKGMIEHDGVARVDKSPANTTEHHSFYTPTRSVIFGVTSGMPIGEDGEPSLPSTPVQLGLEKPPKPPQGLSFSSPRRSHQKKALPGSKSSPLKPKDNTGVAMVESPGNAAVPLGLQMSISHATRPPTDAQQPEYLSMRERLDALEEQIRHTADILLQRLLVLGWKDDASCDSQAVMQVETEKKDMEARSSEASYLRNEIRLYAPAAIELSHNAVSADGQKKAPLESQSLSHGLVCSLLSSGKSLTALPQVYPPTGVSASQVVISNAEDDEAMQPMTNSSDARLHDDNLDETMVLDEVVTLSLPSHLFSVTLRVKVSVASQVVKDLQLIEISSWAEAEVAAWLMESVRGKSVVILGRSLGNYWRASRQRLECWKGAAESSSALPVKCDIAETILKPFDDLHQEAVMAILGKQNLLFTRDTVNLEILWHILLDDEGHIENKISARCHCPAKWHTHGIGPELDKVGQAFDLLRAERGVTQAVVIILDLVFSVSG